MALIKIIIYNQNKKKRIEKKKTTEVKTAFLKMNRNYEMSEIDFFTVLKNMESIS